MTSKGDTIADSYLETVMDRDRLQQVQQSDLSESRVNQEFIDWLKTKGPNWLLVVLVAICAFLFIQQWKQRQVSYVDQAWQAFAEADTPFSLLDVAEEYGDVGSVAALSRLTAARIFMTAVQVGKPVQAIILQENTAALIDDTGEDEFTDELRDDYLNQADGLYQSILDDPVLADAADTSAANLYAVNALNGRAAVAEARGESEQAAAFYEEAAARADEFDPSLADISRAMAQAAEAYSERVILVNNPNEVQSTQDNPFATVPIDQESGLKAISTEPSLSSIINV